MNENTSPNTGTSTRTTGTSKLALLAAFVAGAAAAWFLITINSEPIEPAATTTVPR
jgi:HAMP domain-containing protein